MMAMSTYYFFKRQSGSKPPLWIGAGIEEEWRGIKMNTESLQEEVLRWKPKLPL